MNDAQGKEQASGIPTEVSGEETTAGTPDKQVSAEPTGPIKFDVTKEYQFGEGDDAVSLPGTDIQNMLGQAAQARKWQGEADSAKSRAEQSEQQLLAEQEKAVALAQTVAQMEQQQEIAKQIKESLPAASPQSPPASDDAWYEPDKGQQAPAQPQVDPEQMTQLITDITQKQVAQATGQNFGNVEQMVATIVADVMKKQNDQRAIEQRTQQWATDTLAAKKNYYMTTFGYDAQEAENIAKLFTQAAVEEDAGRFAYQQGDTETAIQQFNEAQRLQVVGTEQLAKQMIAHEKAQERAALEAQVESGQLGALPEPEKEVDLSERGSELWTGGKAAYRKLRESLRDRNIDNAEKTNQAKATLDAR